MMVSFAEIELARRRLDGVIKPTPLVPSATLDGMLQARVLLKPENLQKTGSFKIRGAFNRIAALSGAERARGVIAASAGNHGQALAYAATRAGVKATVVMPKNAALAKVAATRGYGQEVVLEGADYQEARRAADAIARKTGALFIDAFDDPLVVAGQGTVGLEIAGEVRPGVVLVPAGGGGLLAGVALAIKELAPAAEVIGVEAAGSPQLSLSLAAGAPAAVRHPADTIADGLATGRFGTIPFETIRGRVTRAVTVDDFEIGEAMLLLLERFKFLAEGAGAAALAGALKIREELKGKTVVVVVSGGNIDINLLDRIIERGLFKMGRRLRFAVSMRDRPGELGKLLEILSETGANVRSIEHDRTGPGVPICGARVRLELETRGPEHVEAVRGRLRKGGYKVAVEWGS